MILRLRVATVGLFAAVSLVICSASAQEQRPAVILVAASELPDAPGAQAVNQTTLGAVSGTVKDSSGAVIVNATVTLVGAIEANNRVVQTDGVGGFRFGDVAPGPYTIAVAAKGFATASSASFDVSAGQEFELPSVVLQVATANSSVNVGLSQHEIAEEQIKDEEKQRLFGIFPAFYFSFVWNAEPLSTGQKFKLAWKSATDPTAFFFAGATATYEQARNNLRVYGQGVEGFSKRFGVNYADEFDGEMIGGAILPTLLHQDPRYFVKGTGSFRSRALHAMSFPFVARGDGGHTQPNVSVLLGSFASAEISNLYYPSSSQSRVTVGNMALELGLDSVSGLLREFVYPKLITNAPKHLAHDAQVILRAGTPIPLIAIEDQSIEDAQQLKAVSFALIRDIKVDGVVVAKAGSKATGEAIGAAKLSSDGKTGEIAIEHLMLQVGDDQIPLRGTKVAVDDDTIHYRPRSASATDGKTLLHAGDALIVYVASDIALHPAQ
jgi:hypothetical protein